jgi:hypothetical protein
MSVDEGLLHAWLDGQLDADEAARVARLVAEDAAWQAAAAEARGLVAASSRILGALDAAPSARRAATIAGGVGRDVGAGNSTAGSGGGAVRGGGRRLAPWMRAAAGLVLAVGVGAVVWDSQQREWVEPTLVDAPVVVAPASVAPDSVAVTPPSEAVSAVGVVRPAPQAQTADATRTASPPMAEKSSQEQTMATATGTATAMTTAQAVVAGQTPPAAAPPPPPVADFSGRGVAGGSVAARAFAGQRASLCFAALDTAGVVDTASRVVLTALTVEPDSSVRAEWVEAAGRAVLQGRQVGDTLRGAVRISAGDIRLPMQERVLLRVPCR